MPRILVMLAIVGGLSVSGCGDRGQPARGLDAAATEREIVVLGMEALLDESIASDIADGIANVKRVSMTYATPMDVRYGNKQIRAVVFVDDRMPPRAEMSGQVVWPLDGGEYITSADAAAGARVAVIGGPVRDHLFGVAGAAVGEEILVGGEPFRVNGVLAPHPPLENVGTPDPGQLAKTVSTRVYVPFPVGVDLLFGGAVRPFNLRVSVEETSRIDETASAVQVLLDGLHGEGFAVETHPVPPPPLGS